MEYLAIPLVGSTFPLRVDVVVTYYIASLASIAGVSFFFLAFLLDVVDACWQVRFEGAVVYDFFKHSGEIKWVWGEDTLLC